MRGIVAHSPPFVSTQGPSICTPTGGGGVGSGEGDGGDDGGEGGSGGDGGGVGGCGGSGGNGGGGDGERQLTFSSSSRVVAVPLSVDTCERGREQYVLKLANGKAQNMGEPRHSRRGGDARSGRGLAMQSIKREKSNFCLNSCGARAPLQNGTNHILYEPARTDNYGYQLSGHSSSSGN